MPCKRHCVQCPRQFLRQIVQNYYADRLATYWGWCVVHVITDAKASKRILFGACTDYGSLVFVVDRPNKNIPAGRLYRLQVISSFRQLQDLLDPYACVGQERQKNERPVKTTHRIELHVRKDTKVTRLAY